MSKPTKKINQIPAKGTKLSTRRRNHAGLSGVCEDPTGLDHRPGVADRLQLVLFPRRVIDQPALSELDRDHVAGPALLADPRLRLERVHLAGRNRVPEEDPGVRLGHHSRRPRRAERHRRVFARRAAAEVGAADDDGVFRLGLPGLNEARGVGRREAAERVGAELLVLVGVGGDQG